MVTKNLKTRIQHKIDIEAHWNLAETFTPLKGEFIIYDIDDNHATTRLKIGNGIQTVTQLPFMPFSAYDIAKAQGFEGSETEWLKSLIGNGIEDINATRLSTGSNGEMKITVNYTNGTSEEPFYIYNAEQGDKGDKVDAGLGIASIQTDPTTEAGAANKVIITLTDPTAPPVELDVYNGKNGTVTPEELSELRSELVGEIQEKCHTEVFDTYEDLYETLMGESRDEELLASFQSGDVFLIKDLNVPDYWWESFGDAASFSIPRANYPTEIIVPGFGAARILETQKTDLTHHLELDQGDTGTIDLTNYKLRIASDGDTGLEGYITFII